MGLDMYAYAVNKSKLANNDQVDILLDRNDTLFKYWRKFYALHDWMQNLYIYKGGSKEFNCTTVRLMPSDLLKLQEAVEDRSLVPTSSFFFDAAEALVDEDYKSVTDFITKARDAIKKGNAVVYDSWW